MSRRILRSPTRCATNFTSQPWMQLAQVLVELLAVLPPRHPVHSRRRVPIQGVVGRAEAFDVHVVEERGEPHSLVPRSNLAYTSERTVRTDPALRPGRVLLARVPLGQAPSLRHLRRRLPGFVRWARR